jgi:hypothetical protein
MKLSQLALSYGFAGRHSVWLRQLFFHWVLIRPPAPVPTRATLARTADTANIVPSKAESVASANKEWTTGSSLKSSLERYQYASRELSE